MTKILCLIMLFTLSSMANDGAAGLSGGDLVFKNLKGVQMEEEDLFISPSIVKVKYLFRNKTKNKITTLIAFPIEADTVSDQNWDTSSKNPNEFSVKVDDKEVKFETEVKTNESELKIKHFWTQEFPAGKSITIEHSYKPIFETGVAYMMPPEELEDPSNTKEKDDEIRLNFWGQGLMDNFCATRKEALSMQKKGYKYKSLNYILKTAKTWDGPIKKFKLTLSKGLHPHLFLCTKLKLKKNLSGQFVAEAKDYVPDSDLDIAYVDDFKN
jgi:hypothetical protein